jgi:hypothetical protein
VLDKLLHSSGSWSRSGSTRGATAVIVVSGPRRVGMSGVQMTHVKSAQTGWASALFFRCLDVALGRGTMLSSDSEGFGGATSLIAADTSAVVCTCRGRYCTVCVWDSQT